MDPKLCLEGLYYQDYYLKDHHNLYAQAKHFMTHIARTLKRKIRNDRFGAKELLVSLIDLITQIPPWCE